MDVIEPKRRMGMYRAVSSHRRMVWAGKRFDKGDFFEGVKAAEADRHRKEQG
jgi:hypothetical protein